MWTGFLHFLALLYLTQFYPILRLVFMRKSCPLPSGLQNARKNYHKALRINKLCKYNSCFGVDFITNFITLKVQKNGKEFRMLFLPKKREIKMHQVKFISS